MEEKDYMELVKENINLSKILYKVKPENREIVKALIEEKKKIIQQNNIFAELKLKRINKKIQKYLN